MAILSNGKFYGFLCSAKETGQKLANGAKEYVEDFVSGFAGHGWKIWEYVKGKWRLDIDTIVVRETMLVFEMLISKIRAIIGAQAITQGHGKVKSVSLSEDGTEYLVELEDEDMSIAAHDFVRCQTFTGDQSKLYHVEVSSVDVETRTLHIPLSEFNQDEAGNVLNPPTVGDELVQFGNSQNKGRQSAIYMHADETGQPAIDVMFGIDSKNWEGKVKVRVGGDIPGANGLKGFYCENGMIKSVDNRGSVIYEFSPNGAVNIGKGNIKYNPTTNKVTLGSGVTLTWDNLSEETKENIKGEPGQDGNDGMSVYITYHDSEEEPAPPTGNGTSGGWHTDATNAVIWMSQKVSDSATTGEWGNPIKIKGNTGEPGQDANLLPWIKEWNGYATQLGKEYIVTPKMFSGERSDNGKLTGIAQGKDCLIDETGKARTGIFGLADDEVVFELDPVGNKYSFKGHVEANSGNIGALKINGNILSATNLSSGIQIGTGKEGEESSGGNGRFLRLGGGLGNSSLIGIRIDSSIDGSGNRGIGIQSYGKNNVCLDILANAGSKFAIDSVGPHRFYQRDGEVWDAPGVLWAGRVSANGALENCWGNGAGVVSTQNVGIGEFLINHYIGHLNYFVLITATPYSTDGSNLLFGMCVDKAHNNAKVRIVDSNRRNKNAAFEIVLFGRNSYKDY